MKDSIANPQRQGRPLCTDYAGLAQHLGISIKSARKLVNRGYIWPLIRRHSLVRFHLPSVDQQLAANAQANAKKVVTKRKARRWRRYGPHGTRETKAPH